MRIPSASCVWISLFPGSWCSPLIFLGSIAPGALSVPKYYNKSLPSNSIVLKPFPRHANGLPCRYTISYSSYLGCPSKFMYTSLLPGKIVGVPSSFPCLNQLRQFPDHAVRLRNSSACSVEASHMPRRGFSDLMLSFCIFLMIVRM